MAESTPLFDDTQGNTPHFNNDNDEGCEGRTNASMNFKRALRILTKIALVLSALTVPLLIANYIIIRVVPFNYYIWNTWNATKVLAIILFICLVASTVNVLVNFPILLNIIVDTVLAIHVIIWMFRLIDAFPDSNWCGIGYRYPRYPGDPRDPTPIYPRPRCHQWKLAVTILMGIAAGLGGLVGVIYVGQLVLRIITVSRTKFWKTLTWNLPTGKISLEISLKILNKESATTQNAEGGVRGPLYL